MCVVCLCGLKAIICKVLYIYIYTQVCDLPRPEKLVSQCVIGQITVSAEGARNDLTTLLVARGSQWHI